MSVVSQDTVLFNDTIAANIAMGKPGATSEEIAAAARIANADTFIHECPDGYATGRAFVDEGVGVGDAGRKIGKENRRKNKF